MDWKLNRGCIPCCFVCDCCLIQYYRCMMGIRMWVLEFEHKLPRILCEYCYRDLGQAVCGCKMQEMQDEQGEVDEQGDVDELLEVDEQDEQDELGKQELVDEIVRDNDES